ncbi:hypothetical protein TCAL_11469 [Tigriopus californicus]|uniref:Major facilitator superfamily (MFS) profile domain-containing protein n=1 Tax=Tigriopus californicus TaxID=6832 RepID=A0A553NQZ7_TIGCA|nr:uncharacterized protein LOC131879332 [Tigriopus californicus]TRY67846.1 hypothetical protein TCAL_11469 [Tigriopus californicus]|eukprot:TCALIF_11469-PA protein Name:"Similar to SLC16A1 Monocarboxylate transporter 1 (Cricetulus longicaudatus)" AED:0.11 eAED:0.12 QI:0/-1/0/1/-1/1/1/0/1052
MEGRRQSVSDIKDPKDSPVAGAMSLKHVKPTFSMKQLRPVKSNPNMSSNIEKKKLVKTSLINIPSQIATNPSPSDTRNASFASSNFSSSRGTEGFNRTSIESVILNGNESSNASHRQFSPTPEEAQSMRHSSPSAAEDENEEEGGHDTITSLAGAKMLQKYRRAISSGSRPSSSHSASQNRLEALFREDLEDIQESDDEENTALVGGPDLDEPTTDVFVPPDGGYGWFVALGAFISLFWCAGMVKSYGVIFKAILTTFPDSSVSLASWIPAGMTSVALVMAPVTSAFCQKYNCRYVTIAGSIICTLGISLSSLAPNMETLFLTLGILTGMGVGLSTTPGIILTARYFDKNRAKANAFCLSGTAAGSFVLPFFIEFCLGIYGFRGTVLILGGCMLHLCISASLYRPLAVHVLIMRNLSKKPEKVLISKKETQCNHLPTTCSHDASKNASRNSSVKSLNSSHHIPANIADSCSGPHHPHHLHSLHAHQHHLMTGPGHAPDPQAMALSLNQKLHDLERRNQGFNPNSDNLSLGSSASSVSIEGSKHTRGGSMRHSFISIPCSLPPHLEHQFSVHGSSNASLANSMDHVGIESSPPHTLSPLRELKYHYSDDPENGASDPHLRHGLDVPQVAKAKSLSLRELYMHQLGSRFNIYKSHLLGSGSGSGINKSQETIKSRRSGKSAQTSADDLTNRAHKPARKRPPHARPSIRRKFNSRTTLMFSIEDLSTDSTSILKESRHPSVSENLHDGHFRKVIPLDRSISCATPRSSVKIRPRKRTISEGQPQHDDDLPHSRFKLQSPATLGKDQPQPQTKEMLLKSKSGKTKDDDENLSPPKVPFIQRAMRPITAYLEIGIVTEPLFIMLATSVMCMSFGVPHLLFFLPAYADPLGIEASSLLALTSVFDLLGRLISGFILDMKFVPVHLFYSGVIFMTGFSVILLSFTTNYAGLMVAVAMYGVGAGTWFLMVPLLLSEYLGVQRIASSYGMVRFFQSFANLFGPIIGGYLWEYFGSLTPTFIYMGGVMCLGSFIVLLEPLAVKKSNERKKLQQRSPEKLASP